VSKDAGDEVIEMSRLRKLIAAHMIHSKQTSAHVTNMLEIDVTNVVNWRNKVKHEFLKKEGQKLTYLPVFMEATVKALRDYPMVNASVDGDHIIVRKNINLGIAVSLEDNNLIVPNIKRADQLNLNGLTTSLNNIAKAARSNKLSADDISGGTFTITNFGTFKNDIGTPIINQPEVAILAVGAIKKKPAVLETPEGDVIAIRQKMWLSLTYDHRIIDGALGGAFLRTLGDYIENFDVKRTM
jgi:2-oxoglutarate dehydrogenase E2 component (dihydrolipoamide succinyltransferase)